MNNGSIVAKPVASGAARMGEDLFGVFAEEIQRSDLTDESGIQITPCILQRRVQKGLDVRVTVVGRHVFASGIHVEGDSEEPDWRLVDSHKVTYSAHNLPAIVAGRCRRMLEALQLHFGAFDFILTRDGQYVFLELNPSGQWGWIERATGQPITATLARLLAEGSA